MIFSERLLGNNSKVVLTVSTNPASATCTLTYNGVQYSTKSLEVDKGSSVSYSVYHSTYGTTTGTITMDTDKTLTCNGTYSTSTTSYNFSRPNLTSDGTLGGSSFAVYASSNYSKCYPYCAVDGKTITSYKNGDQWITQGGESFIFYYPNALRVTSLTMNCGYGSVYYYRAYTGSVYGSNNNSSYSSVGSWSVAKNSTDTKVITIDLSSNTSYYKYYKLTPTAFMNNTYWGISELYITAKYATTSYTYYWDVSTN